MRLSLDHLNFFLILLCAALAYLLPFELVLLSYAILGPAHYLTQINWMHQRKYFAPSCPFLIPAIIATFLALANNQYSGAILFAAIVMAVVSIIPIRQIFGWLIVAVACGIYFPLASHLSLLELAFAVLLPTVIHVFAFTLIFMLTGALRGRSEWGLINVAAMLGFMVLFFVVPPSLSPVFTGFVSQNSDMFTYILPRVGEVFGFTPSLTQKASFMAFLSFAYTYHYLNWFSKAEVIHWHKTSNKAWAVIGVCYAAAIGLYMYDYRTGFILLLFLSLLHVVLEFPLNMRSIQSLPGLMVSALRNTRA